MKTTISLPENDICKCCEDICPENIYDCEKLQQLINNKKSQYVWCWTLK